MKNHKEIMEALLAGKTLRSQQLTYSSEIHLTKEGRLSSGSFEMFYLIPPEQWAIKPKEPNWWENIPEHGVLCWVNDYDPDPNIGLINVVIKVESGNYRRFVDVNDCRWDYAIPLTNEEIEAFKR